MSESCDLIARISLHRKDIMNTLDIVKDRQQQISVVVFFMDIWDIGFYFISVRVCFYCLKLF